jgi:hypothetical protein
LKPLRRNERTLDAAAPQTLTVTVAKADKESPFAPGQVVIVSLGSTGQAVRVTVEGCANGSSLTGKEAELSAVWSPPTTTATTTSGGHHGSGAHHGDGDHGTTTQGTTTTESTTTTTGTTTAGP